MSNIDSYYETRKTFNYYKKINDILTTIRFNTIIDIGSRKSPILEKITSLEIEKTALDVIPIQNGSDDIRRLTADFYTWIPDKRYDVVLCLQVLEHLDNPKLFTQKLFETGKKVIISVPYKWKKGFCKYHVQDPVDEDKLYAWTQKKTTSSYIIEDKGVERLICTYF
jgi:hypothetical protein